MTPELKTPEQQINYLLSPESVRKSAHRMLDFAKAGNTHFKVNLEKISELSDYVLTVMRENYPTLEIPFHSRKNHLNAGGIHRTERLTKALKEQNSSISPLEIAKVQFELVVVSVLLDAGAGARWYYFDERHQREYSRSEGLAVASFEMFMKGGFSSDLARPLQVDAQGLLNLTQQNLEHHFQVSAKNPIDGIAGRTQLLKTLGEIINRHTLIYPHQRLGDCLEFILKENSALGPAAKPLPAKAVLQFVLKNWGDIWPARLKLHGQSLGDVWQYSQIKNQEPLSEYVPFHKLSQWLTYSLLVPIMEAGISVQGVELMTGLPEYRNGGLLLDSGLLEFKNSGEAQKSYRASDEVIIEWRALTVALLDLIGEAIQKKLNKTAVELPLAKVLEGGTWAAGRKIAKVKREGGGPPLNIISDGTVF